MLRGLFRAGLGALLGIASFACGSGNSVSPGLANPLFQADRSSVQTYSLGWRFPTNGGTLVPGKNDIYAVTSGFLNPPPSSGVSTETPVMATLDEALTMPNLSPSRFVVNGQFTLLPALAPRRVAYGSGRAQYDYLSADGSATLTSVTFSKLSIVPLEGFMRDSPAELIAAIPIGDWIGFNNFAANAKWLPGSSYIKRNGIRKGDTYFSQDCTNQSQRTPDGTAEPIPCMIGGALEDIFPITLGMVPGEHPSETDFIDQGTIAEHQGVRMWVANSPMPLDQASALAYRIFFELNGNVYEGTLEQDGAPILYYQTDGSVVDFSVLLNNSAVASIQAGLITGTAAIGSQTGDGQHLAVTDDLFGIGGHGPNGSLSPADLKTHYNIPNGLTGKNQIVAIVDAPGTGDPLADLNAYSDANSLPRCDSTHSCFTRIDLSHGALPGKSDWGSEVALDTQMIHGIAPDAQIILVTAAGNTTNDIVDAINYAAALPGVSIVSMSFDCDVEDETAEDSILAGFQANGVSFFASSGDNGYEGSSGYPASSPYVTGVGGTQINSVIWQNLATSEVAWRFSGAVEGNTAAPAWQASAIAQIGTSTRMMPDVSAVADWQHSAIAVYYGESWQMSGGTSAAAPLWAGVAALLGEYLSNEGKSLTTLIKSTPGGFNGLLYQTKVSQSGFYDITQGSNNLDSETGTFFTMAGPGFDPVTGWGSPNVKNLFANF